MYAFKCRNYDKNKLEVFSESQSEILKVEECKKCLDDDHYQKECNS